MPELPEVETVRKGLAARLEGGRIANVLVRRPDLRVPFPPDFRARLEGRRFVHFGRRAKYILGELDDGMVLVIHLGMSGRLTLSEGVHAPAPGPHDHVRMTMADGATLTFNDPRRFGLMTLIEKERLVAHPMFAALGVEPLDEATGGPALASLLRGRRTSIKAALLDQHVIAGLGNIYACEALHRAGISPRRSAHTIAGRRAQRLAGAIREVLMEAIGAGGSSLRDYARVSGELGYFQHHFRVYDRAGEPCPAPGCTGTIARIVQSGRSTFFCPTCQR